jgi:2-succinyl-5-enolpyruvyl-6-hydroxy-3-cyclohexene-1-carboxylate synthase
MNADLDANTGFARSVVDEWARAGVSDACVAPGSRSTPLALALADDARVRVHVHLDERSASFFALGLAKATGRPVVLLCTSGTAAANFHPAVLEAHHGRVPLIVCTADRPFELRDTGAGQTVQQVGLYGGAVRWAVDVESPHSGAGVAVTRSWRDVAARAAAVATARPQGPVHLNLAFREPLVPTGAPPLEHPGRLDGAPWVTVHRGKPAPAEELLSDLLVRCGRAERGILVAGWGTDAPAALLDRLARTLGWPLLADPISGARVGPNTISTYEALARAGYLHGRVPDLVVRFGAAVTSKPVTSWLDYGVPQVVVDADGAWLDPERASSDVVAVDGQLLAHALVAACSSEGAAARTSPWLDEWLAAERAARAVVDGVLDSWAEPFEGRVARDVIDAVPEGSALVVASSMPVRDLEAFARPRAGVRFFANRGVNGIDGFVSTVLGVAAASPRSHTVALLGDLCFLHDSNGLLGAVERGIDATFVVLDNGGGGIFSFLPQAGHGAHFETLFATPHSVDLAALAAVHGVHTTRVEKALQVVPALHDAIEAGGVRLVLVPVDRADNVARHRAVWDAVAAALPRDSGVISSEQSG